MRTHDVTRRPWAAIDAFLVDTLKGLGPFTVFAPTDAAFAKLPGQVVPAEAGKQSYKRS